MQAWSYSFIFPAFLLPPQIVILKQGGLAWPQELVVAILFAFILFFFYFFFPLWMTLVTCVWLLYVLLWLSSRACPHVALCSSSLPRCHGCEASAGSPSAPLESGHGKWLIFHRGLKLLMWKIFWERSAWLWSCCPFPHFARIVLCQQGTQWLCFTLLVSGQAFWCRFPIFWVFFSHPSLEATWSCDKCTLSSGLQQECFRLQVQAWLQKAGSLTTFAPACSARRERGQTVKAAKVGLL